MFCDIIKRYRTVFFPHEMRRKLELGSKSGIGGRFHTIIIIDVVVSRVQLFLIDLKCRKDKIDKEGGRDWIE